MSTLPVSLFVYTSITKNNLDFHGYIEELPWHYGTTNGEALNPDDIDWRLWKKKQKQLINMSMVEKNF